MNDELLTPKEVREMTHFSKAFLVTLDTNGQLPAIRVGKTGKTGGHRRYKRSDVERYMEEGNL